MLQNQLRLGSVEWVKKWESECFTEWGNTIHIYSSHIIFHKFCELCGMKDEVLDDKIYDVKEEGVKRHHPENG